MNNEEKILTSLENLSSKYDILQENVKDLQENQIKMQANQDEMKKDIKDLQTSQNEMKKDIKELQVSQNEMLLKIEDTHRAVVLLENELIPKINVLFDAFQLSLDYSKQNLEPRVLKLEKSVDTLQIDVTALKLKKLNS